MEREEIEQDISENIDVSNNSTFNLSLEAVLELTDEDSLIVLGESA